jgi:hypothetical protein
MTVFTLKAKNDHLQKVASTRDYIKAISEFVWNALDADATAVSVEFLRNALDGLEGIIIREDGTGISRARAEHDFESLGESWKLSKTHTLQHHRVSLQTTCPAGDSLTQDRAKHSNIDRVP